MGRTMIQKIFENHSMDMANVGDIIDIKIDVRAARDFGGANVVKNLENPCIRRTSFQNPHTCV